MVDRLRVCTLLFSIFFISAFSGTLKSMIQCVGDYEDNDSDYGRTVKPTSDGGFINFGYTYSDVYGINAINQMIMKYSSYGQVEFGKVFGGAGEDTNTYGEETSDKGYVVSSYTTSFNVLKIEGMINKFDSNGDLVFSKTYGGDDDDHIFSVSETSTGYIATGDSDSFGAGDFDMFIVNLDFNGNVTFAKTIGGSNSDYGRFGFPTSDGGYFFCGQTKSFAQEALSTDAFFVKMDSSFQLSWVKTLSITGTGSTTLTYCQMASETHDGGFVFTGSTNGILSSDNLLTAKLDSTGELVWCSTFRHSSVGGSNSIQLLYPQLGKDEKKPSGKEVEEGYIVSGYCDTYAVFLKYFRNGSLSFAKRFGNPVPGDIAYFASQSLDRKSVLFTGYTRSYGHDTITPKSDLFVGLVSEEDGASCFPGWTDVGSFDITMCTNISISGDIKGIVTYEDQTNHNDFIMRTVSPTVVVISDVVKSNESIIVLCKEYNECYGKLANDTSIINNSAVCSGHGNCNGDDDCDCDPGYYNKYCNSSICVGAFTDPLTNITTVCSNHGNCEGVGEMCYCDEGYYGIICNITMCNSVWNNDTINICSGNGNCSNLDVCTCDKTWHGKDCNVTECFGVPASHDNVCSGHGTCISKNNCSCTNQSLEYFGKSCESHYCFGILNNNTHVCSGHGTCISKNNCTCLGNYSHDTSSYKKDCSEWACYGYSRHNASIVCSGKGNCSAYNNCSCPPYYNETSDCDWNCFGINSRDTSYHPEYDKKICDNHGVCVDVDTCNCTDSYVGIECTIPTCWGIPGSSKSTVCGGHGTCNDPGDDCTCDDGYAKSVSDTICDNWQCFGVQKDVTSKVCSKKGTCTGNNICDCFKGYEGNDCETFKCGYDKDSPKTCSGNGKCEEPSKCKCNVGFRGDLCEQNMLYYTVMAPILSVAGISGVSFFLCFCFLCCAGCCVCCFVVITVGIVLATVLIFQKFRLLKFDKLRDVDILLEEQRIENDTNIAHIKMNKRLFEIPYSEIKVVRTLGEGGSMSIVYLAKWKGRDCAFKCFKTRLVCSSQNSFDEFEKEVEVFSSISHPNVVRFYGASMNPPRVGILMEFCEKGECYEYIVKYEEENGKPYPMNERIRMLSEIASSMEYIHSRSIVHRDLKCENVLLNKNEECKLMDFGLAKISERLSQQRTKRIGTSIYMAPEVASGEESYTEKCDVFSFAIVCFVMVSGNDKPYGKKNLFNIELKVAQNPSFRPDIKEMSKIQNQDLWLIELTKRMWSHNSKDRPGFDEIIEMFEKKKSIEGKKYDDEKEEEEDDDEKNIITIQKKELESLKEQLRVALEEIKRLKE